LQAFHCTFGDDFCSKPSTSLPGAQNELHLLERRARLRNGELAAALAFGLVLEAAKILVFAHLLIS
jgi:hypothetical protein